MSTMRLASDTDSETVRLSLLARGRGNHLCSGYTDRQQLVGEALADDDYNYPLMTIRNAH